MFRLVGLVVSIGLADSLNPSTIAPALYFASGERARARVFEFTAAVFLVFLAGGTVIALGPGQLLLSLVPHPSRHTGFILEVVAGAAMLTGGVFLWSYRDRLARHEVPQVDPHGKSSAVLGVTISAVELPTAFPYFAAIAAIVGSGLGPARQFLLLVVFNICFVLPLLGIIATLTFAGDRAQEMLATGRRFLERHWPTVLSVLAIVAGLFVIALGVTGLAGARHRVGRLLHRILHPDIT
jgi:cytochrome c biogenesis protein CcdA